jgi:hypothetical protein
MTGIPENLVHLLRVVDHQGNEHFVNLHAVADIQFSEQPGRDLMATIVTAALDVNPNTSGQPHRIVLRGDQAEHLRRELRRRAGVADGPGVPVDHRDARDPRALPPTPPYRR